MIIYSQVGARPDADALKAFLKMDKKGCVSIKGGKYYIQPNPTEEYLNGIFDAGIPYCLSECAEKNDKKLPGCMNPFIVSSDTAGNWVAWLNKKLIPIDTYLSTDGKVFYSDLQWKKQQQVLTLINGGKASGKKCKLPDSMNYMAKELCTLFSKDFRLAYATWSAQDRRWRKNCTNEIARPFYYERSLYIGRHGGWVIDEQMLKCDWGTFEEGFIKNKEFGKIEKYIVSYIREMQALVYKNHDHFTYSDKTYYECEIQAAWVVLGAVRLLKSKNKKVCEKNIDKILDNIMPTIVNTCGYEDTLGIYFMQHVDYIEEHIMKNIS